MIATQSSLTLEEFLLLPVNDTAYELINGQAIPKMSPKFFHARLQKTLLFIFEDWSKNKGRIEAEWAIIFQKNAQNWVPVPDLTYISYERLCQEWMKDEACPNIPELVIEIISPGQTFGEMTQKATDYLQAGVDRVWIVDTKAQTITIFYPNMMPQNFQGEMTITDDLLPDFQVTVQDIFTAAGFVK